MVLLVCAGMLGRTMLRLASLDPGVNTRNVLTARMALSPGILGDPAKIRAAWQNVLENGARVPGVQSIAMVDTVPMREGKAILFRVAEPKEDDRRPAFVDPSHGSVIVVGRQRPKRRTVGAGQPADGCCGEAVG